jgi:galactonate dehydratase
MRITSAEIYDARPQDNKQGLNLVLLRLWTDEGIYGLGEVALAYGTGSAAGLAMLKQLVERFVIGADPFRIEEIWFAQFRRTFWALGGGPVVYGGMSAIDEALWDIKGKALGVPVYELMGGLVNERLRLYANGWSNIEGPDGRPLICTPDEYGRAVQQVISDGYDALKFDPFYINADRRRWTPTPVLSKEMMDLAEGRVAAVREAVGPDVDICVEVHGVLAVQTAIEMGRRLAPYRPFFYEEPVHALNVDAMRKVSQNVPLPIAAGERLYTRYGFRQYIEKQVLDILQPDIGLAGGLTETKKIADYAETYDMHIQPHLCAGPVHTAACIQLDACLTNFIIQEWRPYAGDSVLELVDEPLDDKAVNGYLAVPDRPGLGVVLNEEAVRGYDCIRIGPAT